jgi:hypothetical protein
MFSWFENSVNAFPDNQTEKPPKGIIAFCRFYTSGFETPLLIIALLSAIIAFFEVVLIGYMGELVDILAN